MLNRKENVLKMIEYKFKINLNNFLIPALNFLFVLFTDYVNYHRRILLYPLRKNVDHFSLYLMVADSLPAYGWSRNTYFKLALVNQLDGNKSVVKGSFSFLIIKYGT